MMDERGSDVDATMRRKMLSDEVNDGVMDSREEKAVSADGVWWTCELQEGVRGGVGVREIRAGWPEKRSSVRAGALHRPNIAGAVPDSQASGARPL